MSKLQVGSKVKWSSSAAGSTKEKAGKVVAIIPAGPDGYNVVRRAIDDRASSCRSAFGYGCERDHVSYLVEVPPPAGSKAKPVLYWPIANKLQRI